MVRRTQREWRAKLRQLFDETVRFFSDDGRASREATAVREFLRYLGIDFAEEELLVPPANDHVDVRFRDARFHNVERIDGARARQGEARRVAEPVRRVRRQVPAPYSVPMGMGELLRKVVAALEEKTRERVNRSQLDALVHVDLQGRHLHSPPEFIDDAGAVGELGWRSVSVLWPPYALVVCAQSRAPKFLRERARRVILYPGIPWENGAVSADVASLVSSVLATSAAVGCVVLGGLVLATRALHDATARRSASALDQSGHPVGRAR